MKAAMFGNIDVLKKLLAISDQPAVSNSDICAARVIAKNYKRNELVKLLKSSETDLICAVMRGDLEGVQRFFHVSTNVNGKDKDGRTLLMLADWRPWRDRPKITKFLLTRGADMNAKDSGGRTPLIWAGGGGHADVVRLLMNKGADFKIRDEDSLTALQRVKMNGNRKALAILNRLQARE